MRDITYIYDLETYPNFFLAAFKIIPSNDEPIITFTDSELDKLREFLNQPGITLAGYNNFNFDDPILRAIINHDVGSANEIHKFAQRLINSEQNDKAVWKLRYTACTWTCIDLMQIQGGPIRAGTLKSHEVRLGMLNVQDIPIPPGTLLTPAQTRQITEYCKNDIEATYQLYEDLRERIEVRRRVNDEYPYLEGSALRRGDASIAEKVMVEELTRRAGFNKDTFIPPSHFRFNPAERLDKAISFRATRNSNTLSKIRALEPFEANAWAGYLAERFVFDIGDHRISLTQGGLHTQINPTCVRSKHIVEFDVASYYPNLLDKFDRAPGGLPRHWISILRELTKKRLTAKAAGEKHSADVYKIIINSLYGKLADKHSISFDESLQLQVVINGQLFLLMLMERFEAAGIRVISANTDGIYVDAENREEIAKKVADDWSAETGFLLETKEATIFIATSVNDYALFHPQKGWFHRKGRFSTGKRTRPLVIPDAVLTHIGSGNSVAQYIDEHNDIRDFLYSRTEKGNGISVSHDGKETQRTNRWYRAVNGSPLLRRTIKTDGNTSIATVPQSESCRLANKLNDTSVPADIDRSHYISEAHKILAELNDQAAALPTYSSTPIAKAHAARALGLTIVPKGLPNAEKANVPATFAPDTIAYWQSTSPEDANWGSYQGFGAYTGKPFGIVAIDIDDPAKACEVGLYDLLSKGNLTAFHEGSALKVRSGECCGSIIFRYDGDALKTTGANFLKNNGFEVLYGAKVVQLSGYHPSGQKYRYSGQLRELPSDLLEFLEWRMPPFEPPPIDDHTPSSIEIIDQLSRFKTFANEDEEYLNAGGCLTLKFAGREKPNLTGLCIGNHLHSSGQTDPMTVSIYNGRPTISCFHHSCKDIRSQWGKHISQQLLDSKPTEVPAACYTICDEHKGVAEALRDPAKNKLIVAPTGTGKTYGVVAAIVGFFEQNKNSSDTFAVVCSSKDQMAQIAERFAAILKTDDISQFGIDLIEAEEAMTIGGTRSRNEVRDNTRVAITHFTYVSRRKFSSHYYSFLKFIDEDTHVFLDEIDALIESQTSTYALGSRYKRIGPTGLTNNVRLHKCGMFYGSNNCLNCVMHKYDGYRLTVDQYNTPVYQPRPEFTDTEHGQQLEHIEIDHLEVSRVRVGTTEIRMLKQFDDPGEIKFENLDPSRDRSTDVRPSFKEIFEDHLQSAYLPTVHKPVILLDDTVIDRVDLIAKYRSGQDKKLEIPTEERQRVKFPSSTCNVLTLALIDRRPIRHMAKAKSLTMLTATITPMHVRFLTEMLNDLKRFNVAPIDDRRMNRIIVVGTSNAISVDALTKRGWKFGKMLRFRPTRRQAEREFDKLKKSELVTKFGVNSTDFRVSREQVELGHDVLLTYSFSSLGRGVDLPLYDVVSINARIFKPISAYVTNDPEHIRQLIREDRSNTLSQNIGRILRKRDDEERAVRLVVIDELDSEDDFNAIAQKLSSMAIEPIRKWWAPPFLAADELCTWLSRISADNDISDDVPQGTEHLIAEARKLVIEGFSKKEIKVKLRWSTIERFISRDELSAVEDEIDQLLASRDPAVRKQKLRSPDKAEKLRQKRMTKIDQLIRNGKRDSQIRNDMKVQVWADEDKTWFDDTLKAARGLICEAA